MADSSCSSRWGSTHSGLWSVYVRLDFCFRRRGRLSLGLRFLLGSRGRIQIGSLRGMPGCWSRSSSRQNHGRILGCRRQSAGQQEVGGLGRSALGVLLRFSIQEPIFIPNNGEESHASRSRLQQMVQRAHYSGGSRREFWGARMHGHQAPRLRNLGGYAGGTRPPI